MRVKLSILFLMFIAASCGSVQEKKEPKKRVVASAPASDRLVRSEPAVKPKWTGIRSGTQKGKFHYFIGESSGRDSKKDAVDAAFLSALSEVSMYFGVKVKSRTEDLQTESNGKTFYFIGQKNVITGKPIVLRNPQKDKTYVEEWIRQGQTKFDALVLVSVPSSEINMLDREMKGITGWGIITDSEELKKNLKHFIKKYASKKKHKLIPDETPIESSYTISDISQKSDTAFFYRIKCDTEKEELDDGNVGVELTLSMDQYSLLNNTVLVNRKVTVEKTAGSKEEAQKQALEEAIVKIQIKKVNTEKQISLSPALNMKYLGKPAIASFSIVEYVNYKEDGVKKIAERKHSDNMDISSAFEAGLLNRGVKNFNREEVDRELKKLGFTAYELIRKNSFHDRTYEKDAKILIVGEYTLNFDSEALTSEIKSFNRRISSEQVNSQAVRIKGFDLRSGTVVFDISVKHKTGGEALHQKKFVQFAAKLLIDSINEQTEGGKNE